jgi:hypothetical protein
MTIEKARVILGKKYKDFTDDEISGLLSLLEVFAEVTVKNLKKKLLEMKLKKETN